MKLKGPIKSMVYNPEESDILAEGEYKGIPFCIISYGTHPCAYIASDEYDPDPVTMKIQWDKGSVKVTYLEHDYPIGGYWNIGWDYAHSGDYFAGFSNPHGKKWTTEEILDDVRNVIDTIMKDLEARTDYEEDYDD